jgi:hypothetical protein
MRQAQMTRLVLLIAVLALLACLIFAAAER